MRRLNIASGVSLIALIFLCLAWELWLAPLRSGGSMLALKAIPLLTPLFGVLRGRRYTHQWAAMLVLLYMIEGIVRAMTEGGPSRILAALEALLAVTFFFSAIYYAKLSRGN